MKKISFTTLFSLILFYQTTFGQDNRNTQFDVLNYSINLNIQNLSSKTIGGNTEITIQSLQNNLSTAWFDLAILKVDSILINNNKTIFTQNDSQVYINLGTPAKQNDIVKLNIFYKGSPTKDASWGGFYFTGNYAFNMGVGFTVKPHNYGRAWFPCVDNFTERTTYDFHITTDSNYMAVCNGLPQPTTINSNNTLTWHWQLTHSNLFGMCSC